MALIVLLAVAGVAHAGGRKRIVVLDFDGPKAEKFHDDVVKLIKKSNTVVATDKWNTAADELDASKVTEKNVKKIAKKLKIDGIVIGKIEKRRDEYIVQLKLRAGTSGEMVGNRIDTKADGPRLDGKAQRDVKDELIGAIDELEANHGGGGDDEEADAKPTKKKKGGDDDSADDEKPAKHGAFSKKKGGDDEASDDDEKPAKKTDKKAKKEVADDDEKPAKKTDKKAKKEVADDDEKPAKKTDKKAKKEVADDDEKPAKKDDKKAKKDDTAEALSSKHDDDDAPLKSKKAAKKDDAGDEADDEGGAKKKKRVAKKDGDEGGDDSAGSADASADVEAMTPAEALTPANRAVDFAIGMSFTARRLTFDADSDLGSPPPSYKQTVPVAGGVMDAVVYPMAFSHKNKGIITGLGIEVMYDKVIKISSQKKYVDMMMNEQTATLATVEDRFAIGAVLRYPVSPVLLVGGKLQYSSQQFNIEPTLPNGSPTDIPNVHYSMVEPKAFMKYSLGGPIIVNGEAGFMLVTSTGGIQASNNTGYGPASVYGFELQGGLDYALTKNIFIRALAKFETVNLTFKGDAASLSNTRDTDPMQDVKGAKDVYFGGMGTIGYAF